MACIAPYLAGRHFKVHGRSIAGVGEDLRQRYLLLDGLQLEAEEMAVDSLALDRLK